MYGGCAVPKSDLRLKIYSHFNSKTLTLERKSVLSKNCTIAVSCRNSKITCYCHKGNADSFCKSLLSLSMNPMEMCNLDFLDLGLIIKLNIALQV